jgi:hypothetical protein
MSELTIDQIHTLDVRGKVVVIDAPGVAPHEAMPIASALRKQGAAMVLLLPTGSKIEALDADQMRQYGWVRAQTAS